MKLKIIIGTLLIAHSAQAHPRLSELEYQIREAYAVELQAKEKTRLESIRYERTKDYTLALRKEYKDTQKRLMRGYEQMRSANASSYIVDNINYDEALTPVRARRIGS